MKLILSFSIVVSILIREDLPVAQLPPNPINTKTGVIWNVDANHNEIYCEDPYGICKKKMPLGKDFKRIIPPSVCKWKRIYFKAPTSMFDGESRYTNGKDSLFMLFSLQKDAAARNTVFKTIMNEAIESDNLISKGEPPTEPSWLKVGKGEHVFFAWTRSNYIFSCESLQGWNALNDFMKCFPY